MKSKVYLITTLLLLSGVAATSFFLYDLSNQNRALRDQLQKLDIQLEDLENQLIQAENEVGTLTDEKAQLSKEVDHLSNSLEELQSDYDTQRSEHEALQSSYDDLTQFTYCGDEFLDLEMVSRSNAKANEVLAQWVEEMWGDVQGSSWVDFWSSDEPGLHVVETGYANNYFIVYFDQQDFYDSPNGVFMVSHHCWLDVSEE
jgi:DNA repair exonuclease SbcCD ATPase subunit